MTTISGRLGRGLAAVALAAAGITFSAGTAHAGGCDAFDPDCNQTGGEFCTDVTEVDPATGDIIGYHNVCEDLTIDWTDQTPTCEQANGSACAGVGHQPRPVLEARSGSGRAPGRVAAR